MPQLHIETGDGQSRVIDLGDRVVSFGRSEDNDVVLAEQKASRRHCTFRPLRGAWRVVDEQSSNGTWLGGKPVLSARLQPGDEIEIGDTVITFVAQPSEMPPAGLVRPRRVRKIRMPWEAAVAALLIAIVCWAGAGALAADQSAREAHAWKRVVNARVAKAEVSRDEDAYRADLRRLSEDLAGRPAASDAATMLRGAIARGLPPAPPPPKADWARSLEQIETARARMGVPERRSRLRDVLSRNAADPVAVQAIAAVLAADETSARERAETEAQRMLADADQAMADGRFGLAFADWTAWIAAAPVVSREDERAVAEKMADARNRAKSDAQAAADQYQAQVGEGRLAAANSVVDAAMERLRGTGWDAWLAASTRRYGGSEVVPGQPATAQGPRETDDMRAKRLAAERRDRAVRTSQALAGKRKFADAAVALGEAADAEPDASAQADLKTQAGDLSSAAEALALVLQQVRADPSPFGTVPVGPGPKTVGRVAGATDTALLVGDGKGGDPRPVAIESLPADAFPVLLERAKVEPASYVAAALLLHEVGEIDAYTLWMRKALADESLRMGASAVHARMLGVKDLPPGGYHPHPTDPRAILTAMELSRLQNAAKIEALTAQLVKVVEKVEASKQAKQVATVAQAYAQLEAARNHALELIFDEVRYFYPYLNRMKEYAPVQKEVDERVKAVREAWEDKVSAKVRTDAALEKLLKQSDELSTEIAFYGGDPVSLTERVERVRQYLGKELSVQTFFVTREDLALLESNERMLAANAKLKGDVAENEREQVRITNEYRKMMGHRRMLRLHPNLVLSARGHSEDMAKLGFFDHFSPVPGKKTPMDRMLLAGYPNTPCSENIHAGSSDPLTAHMGWVHSSGHHRNLLMPNWSEMGTGQSGRYWTQNFGYAPGDDQVGGPGPQ